MTMIHLRCGDCGGKEVAICRTYTLKQGEQRTIYYCSTCDRSFSETKNTPLAYLKTPISVMVHVLSALTEGMGINAAARLYGVSKNSIYRWQERLSGVKQTLLLYALTHQFLYQVIEGDELYTRVRKNVAPDESKGWTIVLMPTLSRCKKRKNLLPSAEYSAGLLHAVQGRYTDGISPCRTFGSLGVACFYHQRLRPDEHD